MLLVHKFQYKADKVTNIILSSLTYASARLFNVGNYERHEYKSLGFDKMPDWYDQKKRLKDNIWFKSLPSQTAQDILKRVEEGWKSYLKLLKTKGIENPNPPFYKPKGGHYNIKYLNDSFKVLGNTIRLMISKNEKEYLKEKYNIDNKFIYIKLDKEIENIKQIEIKYINEYKYDINVIYEIPNIDIKECNDRYISIDIGICNLATIYDNKGYCFIITGGAYQNALYYYNKKIAHYKSILDMQRGTTKCSSKRLNKLYDKKKRVITYILHKSTKMVIDYCINNDITRVIIGDITNIRKDNDLGHENNQKLHSLPFFEFYKKIEYKLKLQGITLIYQNEAYTSSCPIDSEDIEKEYQDKHRIERGLYKHNNIIYNADCVGAYNIMRKYAINNNIKITMINKGLSNPNKYVPV